MRTSEYEAIDKAAIEYLVTTLHNGTRFWLSDNAPINSATDILENARRFRDITDAVIAARHENSNAAWGAGFDWQPVRRFPVTGAILFDDDTTEREMKR